MLFNKMIIKYVFNKIYRKYQMFKIQSRYQDGFDFFSDTQQIIESETEKPDEDAKIE
jgi:hypothetical protein